MQTKLARLIPNDDLPLTLGKKVVPNALVPQPAPDTKHVRWVVNPNTPEGEIDQTIQASDEAGALKAGIIEQFEPGVTEKCPDCGVDRAFFGCFCGERKRRKDAKSAAFKAMADAMSISPRYIYDPTKLTVGVDLGRPGGDMTAVSWTQVDADGNRRVIPRRGIYAEPSPVMRGAPEAPKTATGLRMLMEAGMKRDEYLQPKQYVRSNCGVIGCPVCAP